MRFEIVIPTRTAEQLENQRVLKKSLVTRFIGPFSYKNLSDQGTFSTLSKPRYRLLVGLSPIYTLWQHGARECTLLNNIR
jgi:hypothetical protein